MRSTLACFLVLTALLTLGASAQVVPGSTSTPTSTAVHRAVAIPYPVAKNVNAGEDGWSTMDDGGTFLDHSQDPLPADFFGLGSDPFAGMIYLYGVPLANDFGLNWNTDTIVRRLQPTGLIAVGGCRTIPIEFIALYLQSHPFTVDYGGVPGETWELTGGLSTAGAQPIGSMTICRTHANGGTFSANLDALFLLKYKRTSPLPQIEFQTDCGLGECPVTQFTASGEHWSFPVHSGVDPLPGGVQVDRDADGIVDPGVMMGKSNFQAGVNSGGGGGGGGGDECDPVEHVSGGGQDHSRPSHSSYISGGDTDGSGTPDHCDCPEEDQPCEEEEEPTDTETESIPADVPVNP